MFYLSTHESLLPLGFSSWLMSLVLYVSFFQTSNNMYDFCVCFLLLGLRGGCVLAVSLGSLRLSSLGFCYY